MGSGTDGPGPNLTFDRLGGHADGEEKLEKERREISHGFHRAWTRCVGTPGYNKAAWNEACQQLEAALYGGGKR